MGALQFPVSVSIEAIDNVTAKTKAIVGGIQKATAPLSKLRASFSGLSEAAEFPKLLEGFRGVGSAVGELGSALRRSSLLVGGIAAAAAGATFAIVHGFAEAGDSATKASQKIGIGVETLQELRYAAKLANLETEDFDASLIKLARNAGLAARGQVAARKPFERLGISVEDSNGKIKDAGVLVREIAEAFGHLDDPLKKAALAQELFGKTGANLIPLLNDGAEGLAASAKEARALGVVLSKESAKGGEEFMDALTRVGQAVLGLRNAIGAELLPILLDLARRFQAWITSNLPAVREFAQRLARDLPGAIERTAKAFASFWERTEPVRVVLAKVYEVIGPLGVALGVLAGILVVSLAPAVLSTVAALATLSAALVGTPAGWVVLALTAITAALASVVAAVVLVWANWDKLTERFPALTRVIGSVVKLGVAVLVWYLEKLGQVLGWVFDRIGPYLENAAGALLKFADTLGELWEPMRTGFEAAFGWIADKLESLLGMFPDWALELLGLSKSSSTAPGGAAPKVGAILQAPPTSEALAGSGRVQKSEASVRVEFANLPRGARVQSETSGGAALDLSMGYGLQTP